MKTIRTNAWAVYGVAIYALLASGCDLFRSSEERRSRAEELLAKGSYSEAMVELKNVLADKPGDGRTMLLVARANLQLGNFDAAAKALDSADAAQADANTLFGLRAHLLLYQGKHQELLALLDGNQALSAKNPSLRAQALSGLDRCVEAVPLARTLVVADSADTAARVVLAECYARRGNRARGLRELQAGVAATPREAVLYMALGRMQQLLGMRSEAEMSWEEATRLAGGQLTVPQQAVLYSALADLQIARSDAAALRETYQQLLHLAPNATITALVGARALLMEGKANEAVAALRPIAIDVSSLPVTHSMLASAYIVQGNFEQARQEIAWIDQNAPNALLHEALEQGFDLATTESQEGEEHWMRIAALQAALGQIDQARLALAKAVSAAPNSPRAMLVLSRLELSAGNSARASEIAAALAQKFPGDPRVISVRADTLAMSGNFDDANSLLGGLGARDPSASLSIAIHRVRVAGKLADANEPLQSWLTNNPHDLAVRALLAESFRKAGDNRRAIEQYETLLSQSSTEAVVLNNLAWLYYLERDSKALETAKRAWGILPNNPAIADTYGWLLTESGSLTEGLEVLGKADAIDGVTRPELRFHYVLALARNGDRARAHALLKALIAESPEIPSQAEAARLLQTLADPGTT